MSAVVCLRGWSAMGQPLSDVVSHHYRLAMNLNFAELVVASLVNGFGLAITWFAEAVTANPIPFVAIVALMVAGALIPTKRRRRRRSY